MDQPDTNGPNGPTAHASGAPGSDADAAADRGENQTVDTPGADGAAPGPDRQAAGGGRDDLLELRKERNDLYDRLLRKTAEFDNYRKRVERDRREQIEWAAAELLSEIVRVLDDFERALKADAPPEAAPYRAGVELIHRQLSETLRKRGVTAIDAVGSDFDPNLHQAVAYEETPGAREGEVVAEFAKGYKLGDRLLRPAMVKVAKVS